MAQEGMGEELAFGCLAFACEPLRLEERLAWTRKMTHRDSYPYTDPLDGSELAYAIERNLSFIVSPAFASPTGTVLRYKRCTTI